MKKQVGRPPEKRQRLGPRKILRSKKDKKTCPGQGRKRGNAARDERLAAAGAACRAYAPPDPAPAHKTGACISPPHGKDKQRTQKNKRHSLVRLQAPAYDHTASPPPEAAPAGCRPGRRRMSALAGCGSAGYNGGAVQSHAGCRVQVLHRQRLSGRFPCFGRCLMASSQNPLRTDFRTAIFIPRPRG